jgi:hypothetical protein
VQTVQSNYFGNPVNNAGAVKDFPTPLPDTVRSPQLPDKLPAAMIPKSLSSVFLFFKVLFTEEEYRTLMFLFVGVLAVLGCLAAFVPPSRPSVVAFLACASIVVFLFILIAALKKGGFSARR